MEEQRPCPSLPESRHLVRFSRGCWQWIRARKPSAGLGKGWWEGVCGSAADGYSLCPLARAPITEPVFRKELQVHRLVNPTTGAYGWGWGMGYPLDFGARQSIDTEKINCNTCLGCMQFGNSALVFTWQLLLPSYSLPPDTFPRGNYPFCLDLI